jgi:hypothetical protein
MYLENIVVDAVDPQRLGRFWEAVVGGERLTDEPAGFETRLTVEGGPVLDLCFQRVPEPPAEPPRLHLDLSGGERQAEEVDRLLGLGARVGFALQQAGHPVVDLADPHQLAGRDVQAAQQAGVDDRAPMNAPGSVAF